jgi:hypothetical protein
MFLVVVRWFSKIPDTICVVAETEEKAQEWIDKEMEGKEYSGMGVYAIIPVKSYK